MTVRVVELAATAASAPVSPDAVALPVTRRLNDPSWNSEIVAACFAEHVIELPGVRTVSARVTLVPDSLQVFGSTVPVRLMPDSPTFPPFVIVTALLQT